MSEQSEHWLDRINREMCERLGAANCPFCGGAPSISGGGMNYWRITCKECFASAGHAVDDAGAVAAWNRRPSSAADASE